MTKPDFIIIGGMKCATSTLHSQLALQPGIFMSTPKEPNFFSDDDQFARGFNWYASLFESAGPDDICGESSTHYTKMPTYPHTVPRLGQALENTKFIYVMRHPIDRLVSHYMHEWSQKVISCDIEKAIELYPELIEYSCYHRQLKPYFDKFGVDAVLPVFFDNLRINPQADLERICQFIGYNQNPVWKDIPAENISNERIRKFPFYDLLVDSELATTLRRNFIPQSMRNKVKALFTLKQRPTLSDSARQKLESIFDEDLRLLGDQLGIDLNCRNFKQVAASISPEWKHL